MAIHPVIALIGVNKKQWGKSWLQTSRARFIVYSIKGKP